MEEVLPRDMVNEILGRLSDKELFSYGLTSKKSLESTEHMWKKRYECLYGTNPLEYRSSLYWYTNYNNESKNIFLKKLKENLDVFPTLVERFRKKSFLEDMYDYIIKNSSILSRKSFKGLNTTIKHKLQEFLHSYSQLEKEIGQKYYPILYPEEYNEYLVKKYLYEDDKCREEPDYV
jgi:hypothetical protein